MSIEKEVKIKTLRTAKDFTELLSLSELSTQMEVLGFLQDNLFDYQMNYLKSHLRTFKQTVAYLSETDLPIYFTERQWDANYKDKPFDMKYIEKIYDGKEHKGYLYIVNPVNKTLHEIYKNYVKDFTFGFKDNILIGTIRYKWQSIYQGFGGIAYQSDTTRTITIKFNMTTNTVHDFIDDSRSTKGKQMGWYSSVDKSDDKNRRDM